MKDRDIAVWVTVIVAVVVLVGLLGGGTMGPGRMSGYGGGGWLLGGVLMMLFWALVVGGIVYLVVRLLREAPSLPAGPGAENALEILKRRYARGEITREQFEEMRKDLV